MPSDPFRVGDPLSYSDLLGREHDQEDVGDEARRIDPIGECANIVTTLAARQLQSLPRIVKVPDDETATPGR